MPLDERDVAPKTAGHACAKWAVHPHTPKSAQPFGPALGTAACCKVKVPERTVGRGGEADVGQRPHGEGAIAEVEDGAARHVGRSACRDGGGRPVAPEAQHAVEEAAAGEVVDGAGAHARGIHLDVQPPRHPRKPCTAVAHVRVAPPAERAHGGYAVFAGTR